MTAGVDTFVHFGIHLLSKSAGGAVPCPFGVAIHGTSPNSPLQPDNSEIGTPLSSKKYFLMIWAIILAIVGSTFVAPLQQSPQ